MGHFWDKSWLALVAGISGCFWGCVCVDTDPTPLFHEVQGEVWERGEALVYWDRQTGDDPFATCIAELLQEKICLEQAVWIALVQNPRLQALYESLGLAKAQLAQAGLLPNPFVAFSYRFSTKHAPDLIDIGLFQNFLDVVLIPKKKRVASFEIEATKAEVVRGVLKVIAETKKAFFSLQATEEILSLQYEKVLAAECMVEAAAKLYRAGNLRELEVSEFQLFLDQEKLVLLDLEIQKEEERERLQVLMGLCGHEDLWEIDAYLRPISDGGEDLGRAECTALEKNLKLDQIRNEVGALAARYGIERTAIIFPQVELGVSGEREEGVWFVGPALALSIPIFDFGQAIGAAARADLQRLWNLYSATSLEVASTARKLTRHLQLLRAQVASIEERAIPHAKEVTAQTLLQHNAMQLGVFHLLEAKRRELEERSHLVEKKRMYWMSHADFEELMRGGGGG